MTSLRIPERARRGSSPARSVLREAWAWGQDGSSPILSRSRGASVPLSFAQERLWLVERVHGDGGAGVLAAGLRLSGGVDAGTVERAIGEVVRRHEVLRTTFPEVDGRPAQVVAPFSGFTLRVENLAGLSESQRRAEAERLAAREAELPFDLASGPLLRATLLRLGGGESLLAVCAHRTVADGWSIRLLFREVRTLHSALRDRRPPGIPPLPVQYADFALWQRDPAREDEMARPLAFWMDRIGGAPELLELPTSHPRPPAPSFRSGAVPVAVPPEVRQGLEELARAEGATPYMVCLAAFQLLLARYTGSEDVVLGSPVSGRARRQVQELIGPFANPLVLRTDLSGDPTFRELVGRVRRVVRDGYAHRDLPFERLLPELRAGRTLSHAPVFQVMFMMDCAEVPGGGFDPSAARAGGRRSPMDLTLALQSRGRGLGGVLEYSTDLFERGFARRLVEHLQRVMEQAALEPDRRISRLRLVGRAERARVLGWNRTTANHPAGRCIHQLFEEQAARTPEAPAVTFGERTVTYRELDGWANRLGRHLRESGVCTEARVAVCVDRSPELVAAILGVMKAGGAYVPLDPVHPPERQLYLVEDSGASVVLVDGRTRAAVPWPPALRVVALDGPEVAAASAAALPGRGLGPDNLAYVTYTSGSTGRPKGVAMHHGGVVNYIHWAARAYGAEQGNGSPVFTSLAVDLTLTNLLPLFAGAAVHLLPEGNGVEQLAASLRGRPGFGLVKITPVHLSLLTPLLSPEEARHAAHTLVVGADFLSAETTSFWQDHAPAVRLVNEYGPTETVVGCSAYVLPPGRHRNGPVPVGRPIQNMRCYVLDAHLEPVPAGLPGELYVSGAGVARGYLGRPGLTAERFVPEPFGEPGRRMYRTGDRARWLPDGNLLILGRADRQVKVRGYRVEPGEIETVLRRHPSVEAAMVVLRGERSGGRRLVAYYVGGADADELRAHVGRTLPEYMVPGAFVRLESLPRTSTGKLDLRTLPAPPGESASAGLDLPADPAEAGLARIWAELLGVERVGATQTFFDLGGNSFQALRLAAEVKRTLGCELDLATLFAGATVRDLARALAPAAPAAALR